MQFQDIFSYQQKKMFFDFHSSGPCRCSGNADNDVYIKLRIQQSLQHNEHVCKSVQFDLHKSQIMDKFCPG